MAGSPTVSVVLPTLDAEEHLGAALESLRAQTFGEFETVVVDDGSTDGTLDVVREFRGEGLGLRLVERDGEGGLPGALNAGVRAAEGRYVARQDADDRSRPGRLARQVAHLDANPDVALLGTSADLVDADGRTTDTRVVPARPTLPDLLAKNRFVHGAVLARREALFEVGLYDERFRFSEDYDLWLRLARRYPVRNLQEPLYALRVHDESIYGSRLRAVKLYSALARKRARGEASEADLDAAAEDIETVYDLLGPAERARFHEESAQALLRYGHLPEARRHCLDGLGSRAARPALWLFLALSFTSPGTVSLVERAVRRALNARARLPSRVG